MSCPPQLTFDYAVVNPLRTPALELDHIKPIVIQYESLGRFRQNGRHRRCFVKLWPVLGFGASHNFRNALEPAKHL
jgi:hypothetical protein